MPPAPRPDEPVYLADLTVVRSEDTEQDTAMAEKEAAKSAAVPTSDYPSLAEFARTAGAGWFVGRVLESLGLFESHYWLSWFAVGTAMQTSSNAVLIFFEYCLPVVLLYESLESGYRPSILQCVVWFPTVLLFVGIPMSLCLHRYFSHAAFETSRAMQLLLAITSTFAYQGGALWWAAKHVRHHHHCDQPEDPHSVVQKGYFYAFVGWTMNPASTLMRDYKYNNPKLFVPELKFLDKFYNLPPAVLFTILETYLGVSRPFIVFSIFVPMVVCRLVTLFFNVEYHPAHDARRCKSIDQPKYLVDLVGEAYHEIHHRKPALSKRSDNDMPYWLTLYWMEPLGLVWNLR